MEFLSPNHLNQYDEIIDKIQSEHEKSEKLKREIEKENIKIIFFNLSKIKPSQKISHVNVKIFSDIIDLFQLYREEINHDISSFFKHENCNFYLFEIFIPNALQKKTKDFDCFLNISVTNEDYLLCRTIQLKNNTCPLIEVIPVDENIIDCQVIVTLMLPYEDDTLYITLDTVSVDVSYHFERTKSNTKSLPKPRRLLELTKSHNINCDILEIQKPLLLDFQFSTHFDSKEFVKTVIKNCYHKMDLELFSELGTDSKNIFELKFSTGVEKHSVAFDRESSVITIKSNAADMVRLKDYFCKEGGFKDLKNEEKLHKKLKELMLSLSNCTGKEQLCSFYIDLRRFWTFNI